jgi:uncharacterized protein
MTHIGLLSDTHGFIDPRILEFFKSCNEIWHAGDIGNIETADTLSNYKLLKAVHGNIDDYKVRQSYPRHQRFMCEETNVWITHIGGFPGKYEPEIRKGLLENPPEIFICGHSHILKIIYDKKFQCLHINPGAAGKYGFHRIQTAIRFSIDGKNISNLEIWESSRD